MSWKISLPGRSLHPIGEPLQTHGHGASDQDTHNSDSLPRKDVQEVHGVQSTHSCSPTFVISKCCGLEEARDVFIDERERRGTKFESPQTDPPGQPQKPLEVRQKS